MVHTLELSVEGSQVEQDLSFKFLGVTINNTLTWSDHVNTVCTKVSRNINLLCRLSWFLPWPLLLLFLKSYILPSFDYCDVVWSGYTQSEVSRLETLLTYACCTVLHKRKGLLCFSCLQRTRSVHFGFKETSPPFSHHV